MQSRAILLGMLVAVCFTVCLLNKLAMDKENIGCMKCGLPKEDNHIYSRKDFQLPIIFIGGVPRSGTTLMRTMLDAHPDIRCGPETHVIPQLLIMRRESMQSEDEVALNEKTEDAVNLAMAGFVLDIIKYHAPASKYYCNKDPFVLADMKYVKNIFPKAKFIYMIRDGRATAHSIVSRKIIIGKVDHTSYRSVFKMWNGISQTINKQCNDLGDKICLPVRYEDLVLHPMTTTKRIFDFLSIPWQQEVIHHDRHINRTMLSKFERSTDQVVKPLYHDSLYSWFGHIPAEVENDLHSIAPMLAELGYNPMYKRPFYGYPEDSDIAKKDAPPIVAENNPN